MQLDRRLLAAAIGLSLLVTACGGSPISTASSPPVASQPAASPAGAGPGASDAAPASDVPPGADSSFDTGAAPDLEAMLPDSAGGVTFTKESFDGAGINGAGMGVDPGELAPILDANGKTAADVRMAIASPASPTATETAVVLALQIRGVEASKLVGLAESTASATFAPATVGGKQVLKSSAAGLTSVIYLKGDVLFEVLIASDATVAAIVAALP